MHPDDTPPIFNEPRVIADCGPCRVTEHGELVEVASRSESWDAGKHGMWEMARLLADAVKRINDRIDRELAQPGDVLPGLIKRLDYVELCGVEARDRLSDRVAALERAMPYAKSPLDPEPALHLPDAVTKIRRELAREIVERLRAMRDVPLSELTFDPTLAEEGERAVADWIEREFGEG